MHSWLHVPSNGLRVRAIAYCNNENDIVVTGSCGQQTEPYRAVLNMGAVNNSSASTKSGWMCEWASSGGYVRVYAHRVANIERIHIGALRYSSCVACAGPTSTQFDVLLAFAAANHSGGVHGRSNRKPQSSESVRCPNVRFAH